MGVFEFMEKNVCLYKCVWVLWHDALPVKMNEELAKTYIEHGIRMATDSNSIYVNDCAEMLAEELGQISDNDFVLQWNWLNEHQPESHSEANRLFRLS